MSCHSCARPPLASMGSFQMKPRPKVPDFPRKAAKDTENSDSLVSMSTALAPW